MTTGTEAAFPSRFPSVARPPGGLRPTDQPIMLVPGGETVPEPKVNRYVQVPYALYQRLERLASQQGLSINAAIVAAIEAWVSQHEKAQQEGGGSA